MTLTVRLSNERSTTFRAFGFSAKSFYVQQALEACLEDLLLANAILERVRYGKEKVYRLEDVENELYLGSAYR